MMSFFGSHLVPMFNTASLYKLKEELDEVYQYRRTLRLMQILRKKVTSMNIVPRLEALMEAGKEPSLPFLTYTTGTASLGDDGDPRNADIDPELSEWVEQSPHRLRDTHTTSLASAAYLFDTTLEMMDLPELDLFFLHGREEDRRIPVRKLFHTEGAIPMVRSMLGDGLTMNRRYTLLDAKTCIQENEQTIQVFEVTWDIVFTGKPTTPWAMPHNVLYTSIGNAYIQLSQMHPTDPWPPLLFPHWMNSSLSVEVVKQLERGLNPCTFDCGCSLDDDNYCTGCSKKHVGYIDCVESPVQPLRHPIYFLKHSPMNAQWDCSCCKK